MKPISAIRPAAVALAALTLGGCYYSSPYGYAPYYGPATVSQMPVTPDNATTPPDVSAATVPDTAVPVYPAPVYAPYPYPYYYPAWYDCCWPPLAIGFGFSGRFGGGHFHHHHMGGGHWGGGHWGGGGHWNTGHFGGGHGR
ncbi:hypothetical protein WI80_22600 [Burkholderia ubonensis]|uniref:Lipoprotein n=2 Tax=Burkholderia ubonensis TaxID=101571 RepID=A0A104X356_9BURK|nr:hypothetical protein [Burkholderia ubonensis]KVC97562.1 hypothetical protein WI79_24335 [Burkholderia ubonensis]KVD25400.1 hypothetical protein WI80_22600 [Burkholderia ubonensis]KVD73809.1 hypothetical protein WI89_00415 [Burkholderia ubonensis]KVP01307.1 hypothetical protein WJ83_13890 [Burkholderia ubonensis]KVP07145.1 hypothetical protein WJ84_29905 [Burkholderia ubonensis]